MNVLNPTKVTINYDGTDTDGNKLSGLTFKGFEIEVNKQPFLTLPASLSPNGVYLADIKDKVTALPNSKNNVLRARTFCTRDGSSPLETVYSDYAESDVLFDVNRSVPSAPLVVSLS